MKKVIKYIFTKGSIILRIQTILTGFILLGALVVLIGAFPIMTENSCKKYIIEHQDDITKDGPNKYRLQTPDLNYYEEVTINLRSDKGYYIIFWGSRDSWKWNIKLDKNFDADIMYKEYKGKNTNLDRELLKTILN